MRLPSKDPTVTRSGALTTSLDIAASDAITEFDRLLTAEKVTLWLEYTAGTGGTGVEFVVEVSPVATGDDWFPAELVLESATPSAGLVKLPVDAARYQLAAAGAHRMYRWLRAPGAQRLRVRALELGSVTIAGTFTVRATAVED